MGNLIFSDKVDCVGDIDIHYGVPGMDLEMSGELSRTPLRIQKAQHYCKGVGEQQVSSRSINWFYLWFYLDVTHVIKWIRLLAFQVHNYHVVFCCL